MIPWAHHRNGRFKAEIFVTVYETELKIVTHTGLSSWPFSLWVFSSHLPICWPQNCGEVCIRGPQERKTQQSILTTPRELEGILGSINSNGLSSHCRCGSHQGTFIFWGLHKACDISSRIFGQIPITLLLLRQREKRKETQLLPPISWQAWVKTTIPCTLQCTLKSGLL